MCRMPSTAAPQESTTTPASCSMTSSPNSSPWHRRRSYHRGRDWPILPVYHFVYDVQCRSSIAATAVWSRRERGGIVSLGCSCCAANTDSSHAIPNADGQAQREERRGLVEKREREKKERIGEEVDRGRAGDIYTMHPPPRSQYELPFSLLVPPSSKRYMVSIIPYTFASSFPLVWHRVVMALIGETSQDGSVARVLQRGKLAPLPLKSLAC